MDYGFTATMEEHLDEIANGTLKWKDLLNRFYRDFSQKVESAKEADAGMRPNTPTETDIPCTLCGRPMMIRTAGTGVFLGLLRLCLAAQRALQADHQFNRW